MKKLGEIAEKINSGKTPLGGEAVYTREGVLFIRSQNVNNDKLDLDNPVYIPESINNQMKNSIVKSDDILLNITGASLGRSCVVPKDFKVGNVNQHVCIIRLNIQYSPRFVQPIFSSNKGQLIFNSLQTGSGREGLNFESIKGIKLSIPQKDEQIKIATFLSLIDQRIETQNKIIKKLESLIRGLNNYLHKKYGNDVEISLAKLGKSYNGLSGKSGDDFGMGKPYITYVNVYQNSTVDESMIGYVKISDGEKQNTIRYGDALFTISSETSEEVGISSVYLGENQELYLNSFCFGYRLDDFNILNPKYMPYCFSSYKFRKFVYPLAQGSTRFNLHMHHFMNKKFKIPTAQNQLRIRKLLDSISEKLQTEKFIYSSLREQKSYLLKKLFI